MIACSCALGLATPMAIMVGAGRACWRAGQDGGGSAAAERVDKLVIVKTGTLTEGRHRLIAVETLGGIAENALLGLTAAVEHPLAHAIVVAADDRQRATMVAPGFFSTTGLGSAGKSGRSASQSAMWQ